MFSNTPDTFNYTTHDVLQRFEEGRSHSGWAPEKDPQQYPGDAGPDDECHYSCLRRLSELSNLQ